MAAKTIFCLYEASFTFASMYRYFGYNTVSVDILLGKALVNKVLEIKDYHRPTFWFIENPVGRICDYVDLGEPRLKFHPYEYAGHLKGHRAYEDCYTKKTYLWGDFVLPEKCLVPNIKPHDKINKKLSSRQKYERSLTPLGFAAAFVKANKP